MTPEDLKRQVADLTQQVQDLSRKLEEGLRMHMHDGLTASSTRLDDLDGLFETVSVAPAGIPKSIYDQVKIYVNGATLRLYWYDVNAATWHYVTATA